MHIYQNAFGRERVLYSPVADFTLPTTSQLETILSFLKAADEERSPVVVHCGAGIGRSGVVLAAWLVAQRGYNIAEAVAAVRSAGQANHDAYEATIVGSGITEQDVDQLLEFVQPSS